MCPRRRPLPDDDVHLVVLKRGIQLLLKHWLQPVYLIQKQHLLLPQVGQNRRQIPLNLQRWPAGLLIPNP